jgi:hypothetical protein
MARSKAATVEQYLAELPPDRREALSAVRDLVLKHLPQGYREVMNWGMITYEVPPETYPPLANGQPLCYAGLAAQKNYNTLYLMTAYAEPKGESSLREAFRKAGKRLDMGKCCIRFRKPDDLVPQAIAKVVASMPPKEYIAYCEAVRSASKRTKKSK